MISSIIRYVRSFRRLAFRYIREDGSVTEKFSYGINRSLASEAETIEIEGEPGLPSSAVIHMIYIPKNVKKVKCRYVKINGVSLAFIKLHTLIIEHSDFEGSQMFYIGPVNHLRLYMTNVDYFEFAYPEKVYTMDIIKTDLKQLPTNIKRCTFLKSHLNIPYSLASEKQRDGAWFDISFRRAEDEFDSYYYTDLSIILDRYIREYGHEAEMVGDLHPQVMTDIMTAICKYRNRFSKTFSLSELVENNIEEFIGLYDDIFKDNYKQYLKQPPSVL